MQAIYCADLATGETLLGVVRRSNAILSDYMMGECWFPYLAPLMQDVEGRFVPVERRDGFPYRKIEAAMKSVECIPALGYRQQLAAGVDGMLMCYGAKAGILADWWS